MSIHTVAIDASPLLDRSGHRGIGRYVSDLLHGLEAIRDEWRSSLDIRAVTALGWHGDGTITPELAEAAGSLGEHRGSQGRTILWRRRLSLGTLSRAADILHLTEALGTPFARLTRWGVTCYDLIPLKMPNEYLGGSRVKILRQHMEDWVRYHRSDSLVAISERTRDDLIELLQIPPSKVVAVPTGIDLTAWQSAPREDDRDRLDRLGVRDRRYVLFVGGGDQRKGVPTMLRALAEARRSMEVELVWAGKLPPRHLERFRKEAEHAGVGDQVRFIGFAPDRDLAALYRGALAHVFLSVLEGFGLPVAEAIAIGCPVIVVRGSGCDEIAGDAGYIVPPNDSSAAARAIVALATDPEERARRIRLGRERAPRFDRKQMARGYVENWLTMLAFQR
jgi:glycosyltransferase involved in cell wall biosynthesis